MIQKDRMVGWLVGYLQVASCSDRSQLLWQLLNAAVMGLELLQHHTQQTLLAQALHTSCCVHTTYLEACIAASFEATTGAHRWPLHQQLWSQGSDVA